MLEGLYSAASGMEAQQQQLNAIGNDLANASTTGYKSQEVAFSELLYNRVNVAGTRSDTGAGARAESLGRNDAQGAIQETGRSLDIAIEGDGYLRVRRPGGQAELTRDGALRLDSRGRITTAEGDLLDPPVTVPRGVQPGQIQIASDGAVTAGGRNIGRIALFTVPDPTGLTPTGQSQFAANATSGREGPARGATIRQGALESSNVDVAREMSTMVSTQRDYQLDSNAIKTEDQMLSIANQLRSS